MRASREHAFANLRAWDVSRETSQAFFRRRLSRVRFCARAAGRLPERPPPARLATARLAGRRRSGCPSTCQFAEHLSVRARSHVPSPIVFPCGVATFCPPAWLAVRPLARLSVCRAFGVAPAVLPLRPAHPLPHDAKPTSCTAAPSCETGLPATFSRFDPRLLSFSCPFCVLPVRTGIGRGVCESMMGILCNASSLSGAYAKIRRSNLHMRKQHAVFAVRMLEEGLYE